VTQIFHSGQPSHGGYGIACLTRDEIFDTFYDSHMRIARHSNCHFWMIYINNIWGILLFVLFDGYPMVYQYGEILSNGLPIQVQYTTNLAVPM
jgi:hypothetical protein